MLLVYQSSYQSSHWLLYEIKTILSYRSHTGNESVSGGVETKLKVGAQLQTFSCPTVSKSPPTFKFQCRLGEVVGKNIAFQERDGQTDTHTYKQKTRHFSALVGVRSPSPTKLHGDRGRSCRPLSQKRFRIRRTVSPPKGVENLAVTGHPQL